jgi:hypothetical protein
MSVDFQQTTWNYVAEDINLQSRTELKTLEPQQIMN